MALVGCGGGQRAAPPDLDDDPGDLRAPRRAPPTPAATPGPDASAPTGGTTPLLATLTTIGPLSAATEVPDGLERALPGDKIHTALMRRRSS